MEYLSTERWAAEVNVGNYYISRIPDSTASPHSYVNFRHIVIYYTKTLIDEVISSRSYVFKAFALYKYN